ncbi:hypothetical protein HDV03_000463 [Kappamyces sp. JEL0829]|nr:hypothetical protein HDV03_000463 [Kappamyces sp. JEL0829]
MNSPPALFITIPSKGVDSGPKSAPVVTKPADHGDFHSAFSLGNRGLDSTLLQDPDFKDQPLFPSGDVERSASFDINSWQTTNYFASQSHPSNSADWLQYHQPHEEESVTSSQVAPASATTNPAHPLLDFYPPPYVESPYYLQHMAQLTTNRQTPSDLYSFNDLDDHHFSSFLTPHVHNMNPLGELEDVYMKDLDDDFLSTNSPQIEVRRKRSELDTSIPSSTTLTAVSSLTATPNATTPNATARSTPMRRLPLDIQDAANSLQENLSCMAMLDQPAKDPRFDGDVPVDSSMQLDDQSYGNDFSQTNEGSQVHGLDDEFEEEALSSYGIGPSSSQLNEDTLPTTIIPSLVQSSAAGRKEYSLPPLAKTKSPQPTYSSDSSVPIPIPKRRLSRQSISQAATPSSFQSYSADIPPPPPPSLASHSYHELPPPLPNYLPLGKKESKKTSLARKNSLGYSTDDTLSSFHQVGQLSQVVGIMHWISTTVDTITSSKGRQGQGSHEPLYQGSPILDHEEEEYGSTYQIGLGHSFGSNYEVSAFEYPTACLDVTHQTHSGFADDVVDDPFFHQA